MGIDGELGVFQSIFVSSNTRTMTTRKGCVRKEETILRSKLSTLSAQHAGLIILNELEFLNCDQLKIWSVVNQLSASLFDRSGEWRSSCLFWVVWR